MSLPRILEPELMDTPDEARDYDAMDHSVVNRLFVADFLQRWDRRNPVLDVGTGTAQIPIELVRQAPEAVVIAIDLAEQMLLIGRANVTRAGLTAAIRLERCDAKNLPYQDNSFPAVMSNSIIHHIPEPLVCLAEMHRVCQPGGLIFVRDLLRPPDLPTLRQLVALYAGEATEHQRALFAASLHAALTLGEIQTLVQQLGYPPQTVRQTSDRHWTFAACKPPVG